MAGVHSSESIHPYIPKYLILPDYALIILSQSTILSVYGGASILVVSFIWILSGRFPRISKLDKILTCWWVFTGLTHIILEGYFVFTELYKQTSFLSEVWKENSKADSRYIARDSKLIAVEGITALLEGPACLLTAYVLFAYL